MLFVYVQPQHDTSTSTSTGLTYEDVTAINSILSNIASGPRKLQYKVTKPNDQYMSTDIVLEAGAHFLLLLHDDKGESTVVLDYVFGKSSTSSNSGTLVTSNDSAPQDAPGSVKTAYSKKVGPLSIQNMGLELKAGPTLSILIDALIALGPVDMALMGFSLNLNFSNGKTLFDLPTPKVSLAGLGVSFSREPVLVNGMFDKDNVTNSFMGAVTVSYKPYLFEAAGYYGKTTGNERDFRSVFVFFVLNGPLVTLELAETNSVTGGFGYNTGITLPNVTNVLQFPLIDTPDFTDPGSAISGLVKGGWFCPKAGFFWVAAGLTVLAFEVLQVKAIAVIEWDPKVQLSLFGVAVADMPAGATDQKKFAHVELGIVSLMDPEGGTLKIEGQLSPSSFVLDPSCHLTGGFAICKWFSGNVADDWVFTIGGYHRSFD
ncbi:uncharacterized protein N7496_003185 [Penicillium cataractarum]|uniref:DUF6603 domain-containing protein n=1 Tax=Penicillium cataractarum TaxID=2100454 RepID=A0A9W9VG52_9EURO|nr:uncharacterized protein N7496_003185 [Penicillium cataractarum]KAJ5380757.1 hypothetical protein N7496_003185 [Penicillium cataractarum]